MRRDQVVELLRAADPMSENSSESDGFPSMTALLDRIDERSTDMQTQSRTIGANQEHQKDGRPGKLIRVLAGSIAVVGAVVVAIVLLAGGGESASAPTTPAEMGEALHKATHEGDWEAFYDLFAPDAVFVEAIQRGADPDAPFTEVLNQPLALELNSGERWPWRDEFDWNGDGALDGFDVIATRAMASYAMRISAYEFCTETGPATFVCQQRFEGNPFQPTRAAIVELVVTFSEGQVTELRYEVRDSGFSNFVGSEVVQYTQWVRSNRPDLYDDLVELGSLVIAPDTIETHRDLISEWQDTR